MRALLVAGIAALACGPLAACGEGDVRDGARAPRLYAAASLMRPVERLRFDGIAELTPVFGATSLLVQQIRAGAAPGVLIAADAQWADVLQAEGLVEPGSRLDLLSGGLVVIAPADHRAAVSRFVDLARPETGRLAVAETRHVPLGRYSLSALTTAGIWDAVRPRVIEVSDARAVVALVARGEADLGLAYASDAATGGVRRVLDVPSDLHPPIVYPMLLIRGAPPPARALWERLQSAEAAAIFEAAGFEPIRQ